jgi:hypothetical protein
MLRKQAVPSLGVHAIDKIFVLPTHLNLHGILTLS